ncbi:MAG: hypothetical protein R2857_03160 [Vampirovibrionales bacterium]
MRRRLHQHPELSWQETRTTRNYCRSAGSPGYFVSPPGAQGAGVIADLPGQQAGPVVALRADIDALPVHGNRPAFASQVPGGHVHLWPIAIRPCCLGRPNCWLPNLAPACSACLSACRRTGAGALALIEEGVLDGVGMIFGGHLDRHYPCHA